jgi:hypothetical protein
MGDVIEINFRAGRQSEDFLDRESSALMEALRADFEAAGLSGEERAQYRSIIRDILDEIANRNNSIPLALPVRVGTSQAEIDAITASVKDAMETLYLKAANMAVGSFMRTVRTACAIASRVERG